MLLLKQKRIEAKLTQVQLSAKSDIAQSVIASIETGACKNPRINTVKKIAEALGCSIDSLTRKE